MNATVASLPAYSMITSKPPGCYIQIMPCLFTIIGKYCIKVKIIMILFIYFVNFINNFYTSRVKFVTSYTLSQTMIQQEWISQWSATSSLENSGTRGDRCVTVVCKWALGLTTAATAIELESRERKPAQINFHSPRILLSLCRLERTNKPTRKPYPHCGLF